MMRDFSYMTGMTELQFEAERSRIISDHIKSLPEDKRMMVYAYQCQIDLARITLSSQDFLVWMARQASEHAENLMDALTRFQDLSGPPPIKPAAER